MVLPGPMALPLVGAALQFDIQNPHKTLLLMAERYGPIAHLSFGVFKPAMTLVSDPAAVAAILAADNTDFVKGDGYSAVTTVTPEHILVQEGAAWRAQHSVAVAALRHAPRQHALVAAKALQLVEALQQLCRPSQAALTGASGGPKGQALSTHPGQGGSYVLSNLHEVIAALSMDIVLDLVLAWDGLSAQGREGQHADAGDAPLVKAALAAAATKGPCWCGPSAAATAVAGTPQSAAYAGSAGEWGVGGRASKGAFSGWVHKLLEEWHYRIVGLVPLWKLTGSFTIPRVRQVMAGREAVHRVLQAAVERVRTEVDESSTGPGAAGPKGGDSAAGGDGQQQLATAPASKPDPAAAAAARGKLGLLYDIVQAAYSGNSGTTSPVAGASKGGTGSPSGLSGGAGSGSSSSASSSDQTIAPGASLGKTGPLPLAPGAVAEAVAFSVIAMGHENVSTHMGWVLYLLAAHPEHQQRVFEEVSSVIPPVGDGTAVPVDAWKPGAFPYLEAVVKEALRLYPSVPMLSRANTRDVPILGHVIPAGSEIVVSPYVQHRLSSLWPDPERFNPSRFLSPAADPVPGAYIPFGRGPRACIGGAFAALQSRVVVALMVRSFKMSLPDGSAGLNQNLFVSLRPGQCRIRFQAR